MHVFAGDGSRDLKMSRSRLFISSVIACMVVVFFLYLRIQRIETQLPQLYVSVGTLHKADSPVQSPATHTPSHRHHGNVQPAETEREERVPQASEPSDHHQVVPVPPQPSTTATILSEIMTILHEARFLSPVLIEHSLHDKPGSSSVVLKLLRGIHPESKYDFIACSQGVAEDTNNVAPDFYNISRNDMMLGFECTPLADMHFIVWQKRLPWPITALASFPGSGNTWLRYLLEQVTRVFTGSQECDIVLKASGLLGEGVRSSSVLVVKTHEPSDLIETTPQRHFKAAVVLIRNPFDAILAEYHRMVLWSHIRKLEPDHFRHNFTQWNTSCFALLAKWKTFVEFWLGGDDFAMPKLLVTYEDLVRNKTVTLERVLRFLRFKYSNTKLSCVARIGSSTLKRRRPQDSRFYPYTLQQVAAVKRTILEVSQYLDKYDVGYVQWLAMADNLGWDPDA